MDQLVLENAKIKNSQINLKKEPPSMRGSAITMTRLCFSKLSVFVYKSADSLKHMICLACLLFIESNKVRVCLKDNNSQDDAKINGHAKAESRRSSAPFLRAPLFLTLLIFMSLSPSLVSCERHFSLFRIATRSQTRSRWETPCGSRLRVSERINIRNHMSTWEPYTPPTVKSMLLTIIDMTTKLGNKVREVKTTYAVTRFNDTQIISDLDSQILVVFGRPDLTRPLRMTRSVNVLINVLKQSSEDLAKIAAYWDKSETGEIYDEPGESFAPKFQTIASHPEYGLYWILCQMHLLLREYQMIPYTERGIADVRAIEQKENPTSRSIRYWRDYLVMNDMHKLLFNIKLELRQVHDSLIEDK